MYSWSQESLFSVPCPSLAVRKAVTAPRAELWAHQESSLLYLHRFDSKQSFSKFLLLFYPEHSVHPVHSSKSRHDKESLAATVHVGQHSSNSISWPLGPDKPLYSVPVHSPSHLAVPQHEGVYRCRNELVLAAGVRKVPIKTNQPLYPLPFAEDHLASPQADVCPCTVAWPSAIQFTLHFTWWSLSLP